MFHHRLASILFLIVYFTLTASAQSHYTAADYYHRGLQRFAKGDLDRAIADFTKAIEISSRPPADRQRTTVWKAGLDDSSTIFQRRSDPAYSVANVGFFSDALLELRVIVYQSDLVGQHLE